ncbi:MAG: ATP-binding protein [bacterium]
MKKNITVGKHTLESLTTGMYSDAKVIFREYIQNSVDSIESAISKNIIKRQNAEINIKINKKKSELIFKDNGEGLSNNIAIKTLIDIGNSKKDPVNKVGFRGIGRLAGLGYCDSLTFMTTAVGENKKTILTYDAKKLDMFLMPGKYENYDLLRVIDEVTDYSIKDEKSNKHYFKVIMKGVKNYNNILDYNIVKNYISQVAPVPYNDNIFTFGEYITEKFNDNGLAIKKYNIILSDRDNQEKVNKKFSDNFVASRTLKRNDNLKDIKICFIYKNDKIIAGLWYGISNYYGTIIDKSKKGLRLRKRNFQIGDRFTLKNIFKEDRFSGWFQGEVHIFDNNILSNARRDNFENNKKYQYLIRELKVIGDELSKKIRKISKKRNQIKKSKKVFEKLDILADKKEIDTDYKILSLADNIPNKDQKVLNKVFKIIDKEFEREEKDRVMRKILKNY